MPKQRVVTRASVKHDFGLPTDGIRLCVEQAAIQGGDLDYAVFVREARKLRKSGEEK